VVSAIINHHVATCCDFLHRHISSANQASSTWSVVVPFTLFNFTFDISHCSKNEIILCSMICIFLNQLCSCRKLWVHSAHQSSAVFRITPHPTPPNLMSVEKWKIFSEMRCKLQHLILEKERKKRNGDKKIPCRQINNVFINYFQASNLQ